jgi:hypothetical protein
MRAASSRAASSAASSWKARRCCTRASPAPVIENAGLQAGMPVGPLAGARRDVARAVGARARSDARRLRAEGRTYTPDAGERLVELWCASTSGRARRRRRLLRLSGRRQKSCGRPAHGVREARCRVGYRRAQGSPALAPVDRDGALPARGCAALGARGEHRLRLRHRLPGLDGRRAAVRLRHGHRPVRGACGRAGRAARPAATRWRAT